VIKKSLLVAAFLFMIGCSQKPQVKYQWTNSIHGGGGYVTGIIQHPDNPQILYIRTDVAGMFRSDDGGNTWNAINNGMTEGYHHNVETFALSRGNPDMLFRGSGEARNRQMVGAIHKSTNGGRTWKLVTNQPDFFGNGDIRFYGEKIAVDPFDPNVVVAAGNTRGIWRSTDQGDTWKYSGLEKEPFGCMVFDPYHKARLYAATLDSLPFSDYLYPDNSYARPRIGRLYRSEENDRRWTILFQKADVSFTNLVCDKKDPNHLLATFRNDGIYASIDGGKSFTKKTPELGNADFSTLCQDPGNSSVYYAAICRYPGQSTPIMPLFRSEDSGESWKLIKDNYLWDDFRNLPSQYNRPEQMGWAISKFCVDNKNPRRFYLTDWFGLMVSTDECKTWDGNKFRGIENTCLESVDADPRNSSKAYYAGADGQPCVSRDSGKSFEALPYLPSPENYYCSTAICPSKVREGLIVYGTTNSALRLSALCRTEDDGKHCEFSIHFAQGLFVQAIKEDNFTPGVFYSYIDGALNDGAGLYKSSDWGKIWEKMNLHLPPEIKTLPFRKDFIETELLAVTFYQTKNVCGTNQLLCVDPTQPGAIYFGEADKGIFATFDGGRTWENIGKGLPFERDAAGVLNVIKTDPKRAGWLYAGFIREGLWRTKNFGKTWEKIFPTSNQVFNATSVAVGGSTGNEVYTACEPLFWSDAESAIYASYDNGDTWRNVYDPSLGAVRWKGIDVDSRTGIIYAVSCGNGAFYARPLDQ